MVFYNDNDPHNCAWLRQLIADGLLPPGAVDARSIVNVPGAALAGFVQCHFFAGIGGWPLALALAGWPAGREVWTGSCPCQPFSIAGQKKVDADERNLWPAFRAAIAQRRPATVFGEQVASQDGRIWLAGVRADLEDLGYAVGAGDLCAASVGAPHIRQRLFWVAGAAPAGHRGAVEPAGGAGGLANTDSDGSAAGISEPQQRQERLAEIIDDGCNRAVGGMDFANSEQKQPSSAEGFHAQSCGCGAWGDFDIILCRDGKSRRIESGTFPLAHGVPGRVGLLRGYGNAIVPQLAAEFITAFLETESEVP